MVDGPRLVGVQGIVGDGVVRGQEQIFDVGHEMGIDFFVYGGRHVALFEFAGFSPRRAFLAAADDKSLALNGGRRNSSLELARGRE